MSTDVLLGPRNRLLSTVVDIIFYTLCPVKSTFRAFKEYQMFGVFTMKTASLWSLQISDITVFIDCLHTFSVRMPHFLRTLHIHNKTHSHNGQNPSIRKIK